MKKLIHNKPLLYSTIGIIVIAIFWWFIAHDSIDKKLIAKVERTNFIQEVIAEGEIVAQEYETINIPDIMKNNELEIWYLKITDLVSEGTKVKKGDFIAKLDPTDVESRIKTVSDNIDEYSNNLQTAKLDSAIELSEKRDAIINAKDILEESRITVEQSQYESKATQRQAQISLKKADLDLKTAERNYSKEIQKHKSKVVRFEKKLEHENKIKSQLEELRSKLYVTSPSDGMVVYGKSWRGRKIKVGDEVGRWQPVIATIPDLNTLESQAVVKEIDISKIELNQNVNLTIDAFPKVNFEGKITKIANIGQAISGTRMNGFNILINILNTNKKILPGMTTYNKIIVANIDSALVLPREAVFGNDSIKYVYKKSMNNIEKVNVIVSGENETHMRITEGLEEGDKILLEEPKI